MQKRTRSNRSITSSFRYVSLLLTGFVHLSLTVEIIAEMQKEMVAFELSEKKNLKKKASEKFFLTKGGDKLRPTNTSPAIIITNKMKK